MNRAENSGYPPSVTVGGVQLRAVLAQHGLEPARRRRKHRVMAGQRKFESPESVSLQQFPIDGIASVNDGGPQRPQEADNAAFLQQTDDTIFQSVSIRLADPKFVQHYVAAPDREQRRNVAGKVERQAL